MGTPVGYLGFRGFRVLGGGLIWGLPGYLGDFL